MFDLLWLFFRISSFLQVQVVVGILLRPLKERQMDYRKWACYYINVKPNSFSLH